MSVLKIVVAGADQDFCEMLTGYVRFRRNMEIVGVSRDGTGAVRLIREKKPDALVMDLALGNSMALLSYLQQDEPPLQILAFSRALGHPVMPALCSKTDAQLTELYECVESILEPSFSRESDRDLELRVSSLLRQLGVPAHIKGYQYLRKAIMAAAKDPDVMDAVTKVLYPAIAKRYHTTASRVERAMRKAIEVAWDRGDVDYLQHYFGYSVNPRSGKPTNSEFIATAADILYLQQDSGELPACV